MEEREKQRRIEREEKEEREKRERRVEELERRRRRKNVIWRGLEEEDQEERRALMERFMEVMLDRKVGIVGRYVKGDDGRMLVIVEMENEKDKRELLENGRIM